MKRRFLALLLAMVMLVSVLLPGLTMRAEAASETGFAAGIKQMIGSFGQVGQRVEYNILKDGKIEGSHYAMLMGWDDTYIYVFEANGGVNSVSQRNQIRVNAKYAYTSLANNYYEIKLVENPSLDNYTASQIIAYFNEIYDQLLKYKEYKTGSKSAPPYLTTTGASCQCSGSACDKCNMANVMPELEAAANKGIITLRNAKGKSYTCHSCYALCWFSANYIFGNDKTTTIKSVNKDNYQTSAPSLSPSISVSDYLTHYATVTAMPTTAKVNSSSIQAWKLPWTDDDNGDLKLKTVSGTLTIKNKVVNHAGNTWYEFDTGSSTRGFVYGPSITLLPYYIDLWHKNVTTDNALLSANCKNKGGLTLVTGGFYLSTTAGAAKNGIKKTDNIPADYQKAGTIPCNYNLKDEYGIALAPNTTYYYVLYVTDKDGNSYYSEERSFKTKSIAVTGVTVSPASATVNLNGTQQLSASVTPTNATNKAVTWKSSNTAVATVSSSGLVTAKGLGSATVTATAADGSGKAASVTITVTCNHSAGTNTVAAVAPTCTQSGLTEGKTCKACGATVTAQTTVAATGHSYGSWTQTKAPTCTATGTEQRNCTKCTHYETRSITATGHSWSEWSQTAVGTETRTCSSCGETESRECGIGGSCGDNLTWSLDAATGVLRISGTGDMGYYWEPYVSPWQDYKSSIKEIVIDNGATSIGPGAFGGCSNLLKVTIPESITEIGEYSFQICRNLTSIPIPEGVTTIGECAFYYCDAMDPIVLPSTLAEIGEGAFEGCSADVVYYRGSEAQKDEISIDEWNEDLLWADWLTDFCHFSASGTAIMHSWDVWTDGTGGAQTRSCVGCDITETRNNLISGTCGRNLTWSLDSGAGILTISGSGTMADYTYSNAAPWKKYKETIKEVVVNSGVTGIGSCAFMGLNELNSATLSEGVVTIGDGAFSNCTQLTNIVLPDGITSMGCETFFGCSKLPSVTIPAGVKELEDAVFQECSKLKDIILPVSLVRVKDGAFSGCSSLKNVYYRGTFTQKETITIQAGNSPLINAAWAYNFCCMNGDGDPVSHSYGSWIQTTAPTCTATGTERRDCSKCDHYETRDVASTGHSYTSVVTEPTCTEDGYTTYTCTCGDSYVANEVSSFGHDITDGLCERCGEAFLTILKQPENVTVVSGETAAVTVEAVGDGLTYTWYYKNAGATSFSKTTAFTGPTYSVAMTEARSGRQVYCLVKDQYGNSVQSDIVTLNMYKTELKIVTQPKSVEVMSGETARVEFKAQGDGLTYTWYYKNKGSSSFTKTTSFTGPSYSVAMTEARSGRQVYCLVKDAYGSSVKTNVVTLSMKTADPVVIVSEPKSVWVAEGEKATVTVKAQGDGLTYKWYYKNPGATKYTYTSSFTGNTYFVAMNEERSGRYVYCKITDAYGNTVQSKAVSLNMQTPLEIVKQPVSVKVANGKTAKVTVEAQGDGLTYKWYYKNPGATSYTYTSSFTGNSYSVTMNASRDGRYVYCKVYDKYGNSVKTNTVYLKMK